MDERLNPQRIPAKCLWVNIDGAGWIIADLLERSGYSITRFSLGEESALRRHLEGEKREFPRYLLSDAPPK